MADPLASRPAPREQILILIQRLLEPILSRTSAGRQSRKLFERNRDNETYWIARHRKYRGSLLSVGKIGTSHAKNLASYAKKKRRLCDILRRRRLLNLRGKSFLDAGCGVGEMSEVAYALGAEVFGVDASPVAIRQTAARLGGVNFRVDSLQNFSFGRTFDVVLCADVLYHVIDDLNWETAVRNLAAHTGGILIIIDQLKSEPARPSLHVRFRTLKMYDDVLAECGLRQIPARSGTAIYYR